MKTKIKKDWIGREKNVEELHSDTTNWISEIDFIADEIRFLEHLLSSNYINCLEAGLYQKIETLVLKMTDEKKVGTTVKEIIQEQEFILSHLIENNTANTNKNYFETHRKLEKEIAFYIKKYKHIKKQIFGIIEDILRKKEQKQLI